MPRVYNKHHGNAPRDAVYIGRPTKWGNPFSHLPNTQAQFKVDTRQQAVEMYGKWLLGKPKLLKQAGEELRGKDLVCWCKPAACHGDILLEIANACPS